MSILKFKIFTWNFGRSNDNKLKCISDEMFGNIDSNTINVVGLQEINYFDLGKIKKYFEINTPKTHSMIYGRKSSLKDFDLVTFIFYPNHVLLDNINFNSQKIPSKKGRSTILDTKGYLWADFTINNIQYTIVNIHLPFQNEEFSLHNFKLLFETFQNKNNVIIFGDYNTRSKVDDSCLNKEICHVKFEKNASENVFALENNLNLCKIHSENPKCTPVKSQLIKYDYLNQVKEIMKDYNEDEINFLPSYKINDIGNYSLIKNGKRRLVGYADRILVKGENLKIVPSSYKRIDCLGNDHFPIVLEVNINGINSSSISSSLNTNIPEENTNVASITHNVSQEQINSNVSQSDINSQVDDNLSSEPDNQTNQPEVDTNVESNFKAGNKYKKNKITKKNKKGKNKTKKLRGKNK